MADEPKPTRAKRQLGPALTAAERRAFDGCTRFLAGDGRRSAAALLATIPDDVVIDYYGGGGVVVALETAVAERLGKEAALFLPTGTMAQQATLRVHADRRGTPNVAFHPACHLETHEERGYQKLHGLFGIPVGSRHETLSLGALQSVADPLAAVLWELPQRDLGGTLPAWGDLCAQVEWARERGAATHLDGARLWEAAPYYARAGKSLADVAALFDTVYVSFYKGLGGIAGCCVAGDGDVIDELSVWRTRHGGRVFMMWPYAASALTVLTERSGLMGRYVRHAQAIAAQLRGIKDVAVLPERVVAPMMHVRISDSAPAIRKRAVQIAQRHGIGTFPVPFVSEGPRLQRYEFSVGAATMAFTPKEVAQLVRQLAGATPIR